MKKIIKLISLQVIFLTFVFTGNSLAYECGEGFIVIGGQDVSDMCQCSAVGNQAQLMNIDYYSNNATYCCGFINGTRCSSYEDENVYGCGESINDESVPEGAICDCDGTDWQSYKYGLLNGSTGVCCGWVGDGALYENNQCLSENPDDKFAYCGDTYTGTKECICNNGAATKMDEETTCCGWLRDGECRSSDVSINDIEVTEETLNNLNPLSDSTVTENDLTTPGGIISRALKSFIFPIAGLILFVTLLLGGFQMLTGATSKGMEEGKQRITSAIIGFIILFAAYWIAQLLELVFGIRILS